MNNLKFRVWDKKLQIFGTVSNIDLEFEEVTFYIDDEEELDTYEFFKNVEIMQSTGLKDKNGKEIFEGDIVAGKFYFAGVGYFDTGEREVIVRNKPVLWEDGKFLCSGFDLSEMNERIEVIGNIYENKELLK